MPTYIRKTIKLLPWVTLNINKSGTSLSIGPRGAKLNISKKGVYFNSNIRGTGVYNKTKLSTSLLWGLGTAAVIIAIGYGLGIALQNFELFATLCIVAIPAGIVAFFISRKKTPTEVVYEDEEEEEAPAPTRRTKRASTDKTKVQKPTTRKSGTTRADNAPAKAYISAVELLMEKMAEADTMEDLNKAHGEILDIMYTNIKPLGVKVMGLDFDDALAAIEQDYAEGVRQINAAGEA